MKRFLLTFVVLLFSAGLVYGQGTPKTIFIPATDFHSQIDSSAALDASDANITTSMLLGATFNEISTFGVAGWQMTALDGVATYTVWPGWDHNKNYPVAFRLWWTSSSADDDGTIVWKLSMEHKAMGGEAAIERADTTMASTISFAADSSEVQYGIQTTKWDTITVTTTTSFTYDTLVEFAVKLAEDGTASADEMHFLGMELFLVPKDFRGSTYNVPGSTAHGATHGIALPRRAGF